MLRYILKRILIMPVMLILATILLFLIINISPTDPAVALLPATYTQEDVDRIHQEYGFDDPLFLQYGRWIGQAVQGDFGISYKTSLPIIKDVGPRLLISAKLAIVTTIVVTLIGVPLGIVCAVKQYTLADDLINIFAKVFGAVPGFLYSVILTYIFAIKLGWLPSYGLDSFKHWILPVIAGAMPPIGGSIRQTRSAVLDCIRQDYVRTARSKGLSETTVIFKETLRNALLPIITMTGSQIAVLIGGSIVIETVFAIPGMGPYIVAAVQYRDTPAIMASVTVLAALFMIIMLLIDIAYAFVDPRTKAAFMKKPTFKSMFRKKRCAVEQGAVR